LGSHIPVGESPVETPVRRSSVVTSLLPGLRRAKANAVEITEARPGVQALKRDSRYRRWLACADVTAAVFSICLTTLLIGDDSPKLALLIALPLVVLVNKTIGLYDRDQHLLRKTTLDEAPRIFNVATLSTFLLWLGSPFLIDGTLGRNQIIGLWAVLTVTMLFGRTLARAIASGASPVERLLVLGTDDTATDVAAKFEETPGLKSRVVGRVPLTLHGEKPHPDALGTIAELGLIHETQEIERVVIAPSRTDSEDDILHAIRLAKSLGVKVSVLPRLFEAVGSSVEFDNVQGVTLLGVRPYGLTTSSWFLKRALDVTLAGLTLIALAPLMFFMTLAVKVTSPGTAFFRQRRIGYRGNEFEIVKFRTMYSDAEQLKQELRDQNEADGLFKIVDDPRITRIGKLLRKTSLDELPQLFNVIRGDMSLVGPRPLVPDEDEQFQGLDRRRLHVMPGMTGHWQIFGSARVPLQEMVKIDYLYGANWSLWGDVKIMLRTVPYMLARRGM
jgi:exopolysaccharide biosynthesis polyprenyl glycosylphosphotransferase